MKYQAHHITPFHQCKERVQQVATGPKSFESPFSHLGETELELHTCANRMCLGPRSSGAVQPATILFGECAQGCFQQIESGIKAN